jgi:hypothetical protein
MNSCVEVGKFGLEGKIEQLKRDKNVLMLELVKLRQQQQSTDQELLRMGQRLQLTEQRQQQMMAFLAKAMHNPAFLSQLMQHSENNKHFGDMRKKRRLPRQGEKEHEDEEDQEESVGDPTTNRQLVRYNELSNHKDALSPSSSSMPSMAMEFLDLSDSNESKNKYEIHLDAYVQEMLGPSFFDHTPDTTAVQQQMPMRATLTEYLDVPPLLSLPRDTSENVKNDSEVPGFPSFSLEEASVDPSRDEYGNTFAQSLVPDAELLSLNPGLANGNGSSLWDFQLEDVVDEDGQAQDDSLLNLNNAQEIEQLVQEMGQLDHHGKIIQ